MSLLTQKTLSKKFSVSGIGVHTGARVNMNVLPASANTGIITCLANDTGYENIYAHQIEVKCRRDDILIALSGSGNSRNIVKAIEKANNKGCKTYAVVGFTGGVCKEIARNVIHFEVDDMQIAEDTQLVAGHLCMQWLSRHKPNRIELNEI